MMTVVMTITTSSLVFFLSKNQRIDWTFNSILYDESLPVEDVFQTDFNYILNFILWSLIMVHKMMITNQLSQKRVKLNNKIA